MTLVTGHISQGEMLLGHLSCEKNGTIDIDKISTVEPFGRIVK